MQQKNGFTEWLRRKNLLLLMQGWQLNNVAMFIIMECISLCAWHVLFFVLCQPVHSCIEPSLHELDWFFEIFLWRLVHLGLTCMFCAILLDKRLTHKTCHFHSLIFTVSGGLLLGISIVLIINNNSLQPDAHSQLIIIVFECSTKFIYKIVHDHAAYFLKGQQQLQTRSITEIAISIKYQYTFMVKLY